MERGEFVFECDSHSSLKAKVMSLIALLWNEKQKHGCQLISPSGLSKPKGRMCSFMHYVHSITRKHKINSLQHYSPQWRNSLGLTCSHPATVMLCKMPLTQTLKSHQHEQAFKYAYFKCPCQIPKWTVLDLWHH